MVGDSDPLPSWGSESGRFRGVLLAAIPVLGNTKAQAFGLGGCSPGWTRTSNPSVNSRMLCQLSYEGSLVSFPGISPARRLSTVAHP